jgi:hypothetical protein
MSKTHGFYTHGIGVRVLSKTNVSLTTNMAISLYFNAGREKLEITLCKLPPSNHKELPARTIRGTIA